MSDSTSTGTRSAIVTGGASGIGRALAEALGRGGVRVTLADRQVELARQVADGICAAGGEARVAELDVTDAARFREVVGETAADAGRLDFLFNNAGIGVAAEMRDYDAADWDDVFDVNLRGVAYGVLAAYPLMIRQGFGHIVNTASMAGLIPTTHTGSYAAAKHGVVGLSRALRIEARPHGVRVSALCPGVIRTPIMTGGRYGRFKLGLDVERVARRLENFRPMDPAVLAPRVLRAVERNRAIIIEPRWWRLLWHLERLSPWLSEQLARAVHRDVQRDLQALRDEAAAGAASLSA
jgi:NAD(P)-dependent dehydrogenase (short-subunit alcohol dehydrogenase family)